MSFILKSVFDTVVSSWARRSAAAATATLICGVAAHETSNVLRKEATRRDAATEEAIRQGATGLTAPPRPDTVTAGLRTFGMAAGPAGAYEVTAMVAIQYAPKVVNLAAGAAAALVGAVLQHRAKVADTASAYDTSSPSSPVTFAYEIASTTEAAVAETAAAFNTDDAAQAFEASERYFSTPF